MIKGDLKRYERYKDSEELLEKIPEHWNVKRIKEIGDIKYGLSQPPEYLEDGLPLIRATNIERGKIVEKGLVYIRPDDVPYGRAPILKINDIVIVRSGAYTADSAIIPEKYSGSVAGFDMVLRPHHIKPKYLAYTLLSDYVLKDQLVLSSFRAAQPHLNKEELGETYFFYPPLIEQKAITAYLDEKTNRIDRKIELLTAKADRYRELKQALINETVTRGLDPTVPMKDSGVEWIGEMPAHWEVKRVKEVTSVNKQTLNDKTDPNYSFDYIEISGVEYGKKGVQTERLIFSHAPSRARRILKKGDTLISTVRTYLKAVATINEDQPDLICSTGFAVLSPLKSVDYKYCSFYLCSECLISRIVALSTGVSYPAVNASVIGDLLFLISPIHEQQAIATYLDTKTAQIDQIITTITTQIQTLQELRKTLINDVVTGKIKVV